MSLHHEIWISPFQYFNSQTNIMCMLMLLNHAFSTQQKQPEKKSASLKEQLAFVTPLIDDLRVKKDERVKQFADVKTQIDKITSEISEYSNIINAMSSLILEDHDLSLRNLSEYKSHLRALQKEKVCID